MASIRARLERIKGNPAELIDPEVVERACRDAKHSWRRRTLSPVATLRAFAAQIAHGNTAIADVVRSSNGVFTESAYCQARSRLPVAVVRAAFDAFTTRARGARSVSEGRWHGHRTALMDGTGVSVPDTPALRAAFGVMSHCTEGGGLPLIQTLTLFDPHDGFLLDLHTAPAHTQDLRHAAGLHPALEPGDVLVGDRAFASYVHLQQLTAIGCHGVFRLSSCWKIPFPAKSGERTRNTYNRHLRCEPILVELIDQNDQVIEIVKPHNRPKHITPEEFAKLPGKMIVRAVRYKVEGKGLRTREVTLLTTLIDAKKYPAKDLAELYRMRWRIEVNLRHLKRTLGMDRLKCESVDGVRRELLMFVLVYNAVCDTRARAAKARGLPPTRLSFVDTLRTLLLSARATIDPQAIRVWPTRGPRTRPRLLKRPHSTFRLARDEGAN
jgi:DDE family transposase